MPRWAGCEGSGSWLGGLIGRRVDVRHRHRRRGARPLAGRARHVLDSPKSALGLLEAQLALMGLAAVGLHLHLGRTALGGGGAIVRLGELAPCGGELALDCGLVADDRLLALAE